MKLDFFSEAIQVKYPKRFTVIALKFFSVQEDDIDYIGGRTAIVLWILGLGIRIAF